jgi:predicted DNA-binding transcriptional regulator
MTAREIAWQFRDASAHTMRAILRRLVKRGVVMRSTGSHGIAVFELIHRA